MSDTGRMMEDKDVERYARHAKALGRMQEDPEGCAQLLDILAEFEGQVAKAILAAHDSGYSWAELARPLGITRQAMAKRYGRKDEAAA